MEIKQIRYFLALCDERSFRRAALRCGVSQPTVSSGIRMLERDLGGPLFLRKPSIALTALGQAVHPYLERLAQNAEHARKVATSLINGQAAHQDPADAGLGCQLPGPRADAPSN
jgi:DNA-binding transcriptional LysR family regulator